MSNDTLILNNYDYTFLGEGMNKAFAAFLSCVLFILVIYAACHQDLQLLLLFSELWQVHLPWGVQVWYLVEHL